MFKWYLVGILYFISFVYWILFWHKALDCKGDDVDIYLILGFLFVGIINPIFCILAIFYFTGKIFEKIFWFLNKIGKIVIWKNKTPPK